MDFYIPQEKIIGKTIKTYPEYDSLPSNQSNYIVISGFPYDEGTRRNGGRVGGAVGSFIFRETLLTYELYPTKSIAIYDSGDIPIDLELQNAHEQLFKKHKFLLQQMIDISNKGILFSIGGSNDQSYPNVQALIQTHPKAKIGVINVDSHFDVRPLKQGKAHSGSPFKQMLENTKFKNNEGIFVQFGQKGANCSKAHLDFLKQHKVEIYWLESVIRKHIINPQCKYNTQAGQLFLELIKKLQNQVDLIFLSFDCDSISSKWMPGVSAPSVIGGLTNQEAVQIMSIAGMYSKVRLVDISEFNPAVESLFSSRMIVEMFYSLCMALANRSELKV